MGQQAHRTARRRRLGAALRQLREAAGVTAVGAAGAIHGGVSKISRIETGRHCITRLELDTLLGLYGVEEERIRGWLIALASEGRKKTWWRKHSEILGEGFKEGLALESEAARIAAYQTQVVPGLLQTRPYATAVMSGALMPLADEELEFHVDFRMARQDLLQRDMHPQYLCIMTEGVIRQQVGGPKVMAAQLRHLVASSRPPDLTIQVVPFSQSAFTCTGGAFTLYSYPDPLDFDVARISHLDGELFLEEDEVTARYQRVLDALRASALPVEQSIKLMASVAHELEQQ
ncbi:DUF5753 domain-containing protein [Streptoverticillium reticulum]|uniref:DUF5753 domain-containing protein n=1 Tax=Streptoverticillium reticulum TaxID=1433415 RepID=UPI0039BF444B